jgi:hypothetical protein
VDDLIADYPVIGKRSPEEQAQILRDLGDDETADALMASRPATETKSIFGGGSGLPWSSKPWGHTSHSFGFLPQAGAADPPLLPLYHAGQIKPDLSLRGAGVTIRLDSLRLADYPGSGVHRVLFDFSAVNTIGPSQAEHLHYNATFRAREGEEAAVVGLPIFVDLNVGDLGLAFKCATVNVANEGSQRALDMLDSDLVKSGLQLAKTAQPAIGPLSQIAIGLTKAILGVNKNVPVQEFTLGLDFDPVATGARLREGAYFAVQVPSLAGWDWSQWFWHPSRGCLISKADPNTLCPWNYIIFRVSRNPAR